MSDIFHEVEEDVRRERFAKLWKQYGDYAIAALAVVIIAVAGFKFWQRYEAQQRLNASASYIAAQQVAGSGNASAAASAYASLVKSAPGGYAAVAQLSEADALLASGNRADAMALYKKIADTSSPLAPVARVRAAWATVDTAPKSEIESLLGGLTANTSAWRFTAREILAYADYRGGQMAAAQQEFASLADEKDASDTVRGRARAMAEFIKTGGDRNFGTVPQPPAPSEAVNPKGQP